MSASAIPKPDAIDPLAGCTFDLLLDGAVQLRPTAVALSGIAATPSVTVSEIAKRAQQLAQLLSQIGLVEGETIALYATASIETICAIFAACQMGLHMALLPLQMPRGAAIERLNQLGVAAILCESTYGTLDIAEQALDCALNVQNVRLVGVLAGAVPDGAVDLCARADVYFSASLTKPESASLLITFEAAADMTWQPILQQQVQLVTAALALIETAHISQRTQLLSTLPPASQIGLVAGPLVMLLSGASLHYHSPFDVLALQRQVEAMGCIHLLAPLKLYAMLNSEPWFNADKVACFIGLSRWRRDGRNFAVPTNSEEVVKIVDLHAFGEHATFALGREGGKAQSILDRPRLLKFGGTEILALEARRGEAGTLIFRGAAVQAP